MAVEATMGATALEILSKLQEMDEDPRAARAFDILAPVFQRNYGIEMLAREEVGLDRDLDDTSDRPQDVEHQAVGAPAAQLLGPLAREVEEELLQMGMTTSEEHDEEEEVGIEGNLAMNGLNGLLGRRDLELRLRGDGAAVSESVDSDYVEPPSEVATIGVVEDNRINIEPSAVSPNRDRDHNEERQLVPRLNCVVCFQEEKSILLEPCMHICVCAHCSERITDRCPLCVARVVRKRRIFL